MPVAFNLPSYKSEGMSARAPFKRLILRPVLRNVSPMVIRVSAAPDSLRAA
jgi:hypothetical protein